MKKNILFSVLLVCVLSISAFAVDFNRLPGNSIADNLLQRDTLLPVYSAVSVNLNGCNDMSVINTELITRPEFNKIIDGKRYGSSEWKELWTVMACGKKGSVPIIFFPDKNGIGTSYIIDSGEIKY